MPYPHLSMEDLDQFQRGRVENQVNICVVGIQMVPVLVSSVTDVNNNHWVKQLKGTAALFHILVDSYFITEPLLPNTILLDISNVSWKCITGFWVSTSKSSDKERSEWNLFLSMRLSYVTNIT